MPVGVTRDHLELTSSLRSWACGLEGPAALRDVESQASAAFAKIWQGVVESGLTAIGISEQHGGGDGDLLDQMVALESAAYAMVPGPLLGTTIVAQLVADKDVLAAIAGGNSAAVAIDGAVTVDGSGARGDIAVAFDVIDAGWLLAPTDDGSWCLIGADGWTAEPVVGVDLSRRGGRVRVESPRSCDAPSRSRLRWRAARAHCPCVGRSGRCRAVVPGHCGRVRQGSRAVRKTDWLIPGDQAPVRADA